MLTLTCIYPSGRIIRLVTSYMGILIVFSADNNPMILVELNGLSYKYGSIVNAVDRVNGTIYGRFNRGFRVISERATLEPQYINTPLAGMYGPTQATQMSTLSGQARLVTLLAKSTPVIQSSQAPMKLP